MKALAVGSLIACLASFSVLADCLEPHLAPHVPDGSTSNREDMVSAMKAMQDYDAAINEFLECARKNGGGLEQQADLALGKWRLIADKFNVELRVFKKKQGA